MRKWIALFITAVILALSVAVPVSATEHTETDAPQPAAAAVSALSALPKTERVIEAGKDGATLKRAFASVPADGTPTTVKVTQNITYCERVTVAAGANVTLDLGGYTLRYKGSSSRANLYVNGKLTVTGNGTLTNDLFTASAHVIVVNAGGELCVENGSFFTFGGNGFHIAGGRLSYMKDGSVTSMLGDGVSCNGSVGTVSGGYIVGSRGIILYRGAHADAIAGGLIKGYRNAVMVKAGASVTQIGAADLQSEISSQYTLCNYGKVESVCGTRIKCRYGVGAVANYGYIKEMKEVSATLEAQTRGTGSAVYNAYGTVDTMDVTVQANSVGVWNKNGKIGTLTGKVTTVAGYGFYQNRSGTTELLCADITSYNRACIRNVDNSRIETVDGVTLIADRENVRYADSRCVGIYNMSGATIGLVNGVHVNAYALCVGNSGGTIEEINGGEFVALRGKTVSNINGGRILRIIGGSFEPEYDPESVG